MKQSLAASVLVLGLAWAIGARAQGAIQEASRLVQLSASASQEAVQDQVELVLAVQQDGAEAAAVQRRLQQVLGPALERARAEVSPGQVEVSTGNFQVNPRYDNEGRIRGWVGRAELMLSGRDLARLSALAGQLSGLQVTQVRWSLSPALRQATQEKVQAQAVQRFRAKAQALAQQFGFREYLLREVQVSDDDAPRAPYPVAARAALAMDAQPVPLEAGRGNVSVTVSGKVQLLP